jgi:DNA-binding transcriptional MerR regulator/predicted transcriptional regulator YdeE
MLKIGEFSKLSRVSIRMLRHYDDIGLLKPVEIDTFTGYRYYSPDQLPVVGRITALKDMGFALADIVKILDIYDQKEELELFFMKRQLELRKNLEKTEYQMRLLDTARERLRKDKNMAYDVSIKTIPERYAATVHMVIPCYEDEGMVWQILNEETSSLNMIPADPCLVAAEYLDDEYKEKDVELIAWKTVKGTYPDTEHVKFKTLPAVKFASCTAKGNYDQMPEVYGAVASWVTANGYEFAGPMFNIYHVSPHETQNPDEYVTEVCYPVK